MDYGTYQVSLYRVWQPATKSYVHGLTGSLHDVRLRFSDWICNEFCDGWHPVSVKDIAPGIDANDIARRYNAARRRFRIVPVKIRLADDITAPAAGRLSCVVI